MTPGQGVSSEELIVVGGANGVGKTTFATEYAASHHSVYLGADAIAAELSPDAPERAAVAAGEELLRHSRASGGLSLSPRSPGARCDT